MSSTVIACIDDSRYAEAVCDYAAWSAQRLNAPLCLLHVLDDIRGESVRNLSGSIGLGAQEALLIELAELDEKRAKIALEHGRFMLAAAKQRVLATGIPDVETRQRHGELIETLKGLEEETRLLVVGKRGRISESAHGHIGSHLERIIRTQHQPILIAQQSFTPPTKVMIAFDASETMCKGVEMIAKSPLFVGLPCHLVMAGADTANAREQLANAQKSLSDKGFDVRIAIISGEPEVVLNEYQQQESIDLVIMGAYGHSRIRHFIVGSTTTAMISNTRVSLMVLR